MESHAPGLIHRDTGESIVALHNVTEEDVEIESKELPAGTDLLSADTLEAGRATLTPYQVRWIR